MTRIGVPVDLAAPPEYDYGDLPADLVDRWVRNNPDRMVLTDLALFLVTAGSLIVAAVAAISLLTDDAAVAAAVAAGAALVVCVAAVLVRRRLVRSGILLPAADIDRVLEHCTESDDAGSLLAVEQERHPALVDAARAAELAAGIVDSPAWGAAQIDFHQVYLQPTEEASQIRLAAQHLVRLRQQLGNRPEGATATVVLAQHEWDEIDAHLQASLGALHDRVAALESYKVELDAVAVHFAEHDRLRALQSLSDGGLERLLVHDVVHEESTDLVRRLAADLRNVASQPLDGKT